MQVQRASAVETGLGVERAAGEGGWGQTLEASRGVCNTCNC